jgi:peptidoglycan/LPS O-acetylase OafA/YrhL
MLSSGVSANNSISILLAQERRYQLDSLRALATAIVVFVHTRVRGNLLADVGPLGLAFFFVLSGYLITGILLDAHDRADEAGIGRGGVLWRFYVRRFLRIFPLYYGVLLIAVLLGEPVTRQYIAELATYRTNFLLAGLGRNVAPITPLWSLSVEEHFYLFWPLIVLFVSRRMLWGSLALMVAGSFLSRGIRVLQHASYQAVAWPTYCAVDSIALGCALAIAWRSTSAEARKPWILGVLVIGTVVSSRASRSTSFPSRTRRRSIGRWEHPSVRLDMRLDRRSRRTGSAAGLASQYLARSPGARELRDVRAAPVRDALSRFDQERAGAYSRSRSA